MRTNAAHVNECFSKINIKRIYLIQTLNLPKCVSKSIIWTIKTLNFCCKHCMLYEYFAPKPEFTVKILHLSVSAVENCPKTCFQGIQWIILCSIKSISRFLWRFERLTLFRFGRIVYSKRHSIYFSKFYT